MWVGPSRGGLDMRSQGRMLFLLALLPSVVLASFAQFAYSFATVPAILHCHQDPASLAFQCGPKSSASIGILFSAYWGGEGPQPCGLSSYWFPIMSSMKTAIVVGLPRLS